MTNSVLDDRSGSTGAVVGGALAEFCGLLVFLPGELLRMRMMSNPGAYTSFVAAVRQASLPCSCSTSAPSGSRTRAMCGA